MRHQSYFSLTSDAAVAYPTEKGRFIQWRSKKYAISTSNFGNLSTHSTWEINPPTSVSLTQLTWLMDVCVLVRERTEEREEAWWDSLWIVGRNIICLRCGMGPALYTFFSFFYLFIYFPFPFRIWVNPFLFQFRASFATHLGYFLCYAFKFAVNFFHFGLKKLKLISRSWSH